MLKRILAYGACLVTASIANANQIKHAANEYQVLANGTVTCANYNLGEEFNIGDKKYLVVGDNDSVTPIGQNINKNNGIHLCTTHVTNMRKLFTGRTVTDDLTDWDTANVTSMSQMFQDAKDFNQPLNNWNVD